jgi:hypothetical protein
MNQCSQVTRRISAPAAGRGLIQTLDVLGFRDINAGYGFDVSDALLLKTGGRLPRTGAAFVALVGAIQFASAFGLAGGSDEPSTMRNAHSAIDRSTGTSPFVLGAPSHLPEEAQF